MKKIKYGLCGPVIIIETVCDTWTDKIPICGRHKSIQNHNIIKNTKNSAPVQVKRPGSA